MADVFISYKRSDRQILDQLLQQMQYAIPKIDLWFDERIPGGDDWWSKILDEIRACRIFIYLISDDALESEYCQRELRQALAWEKHVIPVLINQLNQSYLIEGEAYSGSVPEDLIYELRQKQHIDLSGGLDGSSTSKLWGAITLKLFHSAEQLRLTSKERWFLSNQFAILAKLYPDSGYDDMREIVERGYELHYDWIMDSIFDNQFAMDGDDCSLVIDILDMFSALQSCYVDIADKSGINAEWIQFCGFDGGKESKYKAFTRFLMEREGKFTWLLRNKAANDPYDSHQPVLPRYCAMLAAWKQSRNQYNLAKDDIIRITSVAV